MLILVPSLPLFPSPPRSHLDPGRGRQPPRAARPLRAAVDRQQGQPPRLGPLQADGGAGGARRARHHRRILPSTKGQTLTASDTDRLFSRLFSGGAAISSRLGTEGRGMGRALMNIIASGAAKNPEELDLFIHSTLLAICAEDEEELQAAKSYALEKLCQAEDHMRNFVVKDEASGAWRPTPLGLASTYAGFTPEEAVDVYSDLRKAALDGLVLMPETELHPLFLLTPAGDDLDDRIKEPQWRAMAAAFAQLGEYDKLVAKKVGVLEHDGISRIKRFGVPVLGGKEDKGNSANTAAAAAAAAAGGSGAGAAAGGSGVGAGPVGGGNNNGPARQKELRRVYLRFFRCLVLQELINEKPADSVATKFALKVKDVQDLQVRRVGRGERKKGGPYTTSRPLAPPAHPSASLPFFLF
jgi:hypothetical protein